ncbi:MAG: LCP family protein [Clostridia bacterium]|nr:LCP family protein [Clostridia bacterium]
MRSERKTDRKKKKLSAGKIVLIVLLALILLLILAGVIFVNHYLNQINRIERGTAAIDPENEDFETDFGEDRTVEDYTRDTRDVDVNKNGFFRENGYIFYYEKGLPVHAGLIKIDGNYYYVNSDGRVVTGAAYYITETNGLMPEGFYKFDDEGRMITGGKNPSTDKTIPVSTGEVIIEPPTDPADEPHQWVEDTARSVAPTCRDQGLRVLICKNCGAEQKEILPALPAHSWDEAGTVTRAPTCTETGIRTYTCTVCGETRTETVEKLAEHRYTEQWQADKNGHWYECSVCHAKVNSAAHTPGPAATEQSAQICTVCGYTLHAALPHTHKLAAEWSFDSDGHWHVCTGCGEAFKSAAHVYDNACDPDCNECGYIRTVTHRMKTVWSSDGSSHWHECEVCGKRTDTAPHVFDTPCDPDCSECGYRRAVSHTPGTAWSSDPDAHRHICSKCGAPLESAPHVYDNACDPDCNVCGYTRTVTHTMKTVWSSDGSSHWHACSVCGLKADSAPHRYDDPCDPDCNDCGHIRPVAHAPGEAWISSDGQHWHVCSKCGEALDPAAHTPGPAATEQAPQTCTVCGYVLAPMLEHTHRWASVLTFDGTGHWYACAGCGEKKDPAAHVFDNACDTDCNICGYVRTIRHTYVRSSDGSGHWDVCSVCGARTEPEAHIFDNSCDASCNACGYTRTITHSMRTVWSSDGSSHWHACSVCGLKDDVAAHVFDNACDTDCNICGYVRAITHAYAVRSDGGTHWSVCSVCGETTAPEAHLFDNACDTDCSVCGFTRKTTHVMSDAWKAGSTAHWHACTVCGHQEDVAVHVYDNSCDTTCNICGYTRKVTHKTASVWTKDGLSHWHVCTVCGFVTDKSAHVYDNACDPTCNVCGYTRKTAHQVSDEWTFDGTSHWHVCKVCKAKLDTAPHTPGKPATATTDQVCTICGQVLARALGEYKSDSGGHWSVGIGIPGSGDFAVHTYNGQGVCTVCGYKKPAAGETETEFTPPSDLPEIPDSKELYNVLLVGTDLSTAETGMGNSDSMMLVSINLKTGQIAVISFLRDLYVSIPGGYSDNRINAAYRFGGALLLKETITYNFNVPIDACVTVDFEGFKDIIDAMGGVTVSLTAKEAEKLNAADKDCDFKTGPNLLMGFDALRYARLRSIDSDFERTGRQRNVITALFNKIKKLSLPDMIKVMDALLPYVSTDLNNREMLSLLTKIGPKLSKITLKTYSIPNRYNHDEYYNATINKMMVLVPYKSVIKERLFNQYLPYSR